MPELINAPGLVNAPKDGGATTGSASIVACPFTVAPPDVVESINRMLDKADEVLKKMQEAINKINSISQSTLGKIIRFLSGGVADAFLAALRQINAAFANVRKVIAQLKSFLLKAGAPWMIKDMGDQMMKCLRPKVSGLRDGLARDNFASTKTWEDERGQKFSDHVDRQYDASVQLSSSFGSFAQQTFDVGQKGATATTVMMVAAAAALASLIKGIIDAVVGVAACSSGVGAPVGIAAIAKAVAGILSAVAAIIGAITVYVNFMRSISQAITSFANAQSSSLAPWPNGPGGK